MFGADAALGTPPALKAFLASEQPAAAGSGAVPHSPPRIDAEVLAPTHVPETTTVDERRPFRSADLAPVTHVGAHESVPSAVFETPRPAAEDTGRLLAGEPSATRVDDMVLTATMLDEMAPVSQQETIPMVARIRVHRPTKWGVVFACTVLVLASVGVPAARRYFSPRVAPVTSGRLSIATSPAGVSVLVDNQAKGVTPVDLTVAPGVHSVELRGDGEPRRLSVRVDAGAVVSQYLELPTSAPALGGLLVKSDPPGARVSIDGIAQGTSPVNVGGLAPGEHTVVIEGDAGSTTQTVVVEPGVTGALTTQLSNQSAPASGWISVSAPAELQLFENGRLVGSSQSDRVMVLAGTHQLELVNQILGFRATRSVQVSPGKTSTVKLEFPTGIAAFNATPWAEVWVDGTRVGETPIGNLAVTIGAHEIIFKHPELGEQKHVATVTLTAPTRLSVDMRKK